MFGNNWKGPRNVVTSHARSETIAEILVASLGPLQLLHFAGLCALFLVDHHLVCIIPIGGPFLTGGPSLLKTLRRSWSLQVPLSHQIEQLSCCFAPPSARNFRSSFLAISIASPVFSDFHSISVDFSHFQSFSVTFQSLSVAFSHLSSLSVIFNHFDSVKTQELIDNT